MYKEIVLTDFEYTSAPGELPVPICLVAFELLSGRKHRLFQDDLLACATPPYPIGSDTLFVAYYAVAELGCHIALNWPLPANVLDLYVEFRNQTNGLPLPCGRGLLGAMVYFGLESIGSVEKDAMRQLALRGAPFTAEEAHALLDYCESDVLALSKVFAKIFTHIDLPRALLRGRYMVAAARIERNGTPVDVATLNLLRTNWSKIKLKLVTQLDAARIYDHTTFKVNRWTTYMTTAGIAWPLLPTGRPDLSDETFDRMAKRYPALIEPYRQLRFLLSQMRLEKLAVGTDDRNRCMLSAFRSITGRNQPSNTKFIFGPAVWLRSLIRPQPGYGLAYIDWSQQEFGIAAYLSGDEAMMRAYESGDPYLAFAKQAGAVPADATEATHGPIREQFKKCALGVLYGIGADSLARDIGQSTAHARELLWLHHEAYPTFWRWSDNAVNYAELKGSIYTVFGWFLHLGPGRNPRTIRNFPMQANGAEMMRLACCLTTEHGIRVCAPVHDAILIESPICELESAVEAAQKAIAKASSVVLGGTPLRSDAKLITYPDRFTDPRGQEMWNATAEILNELVCGSTDSNSSLIYISGHTPNRPDTPDTLETPNSPNTPNTPETPDTPDGQATVPTQPLQRCGIEG